MTPNKACAGCGLYPSPLHGGFVDIYLSDSGATYSGVKTCSKIWLCPVCSAAIRQARAREIEQGCAMHLGIGGGLGFGTFTLPHKITTPLAESLAAVRSGYKSVREHYATREAFADLGVDGAIRALEITYGRNGWHPHLHLLWLTRTALNPAACEELRSVLYAGWSRHLDRIGWSAPSEARGVLVLPVSLVKGSEGMAAYLSKVQDPFGAPSTVSREMARGDLKKGRKTSRTPFEVAESAVAGDRRDAARFLEYAAATHGARAIEWSRGLKGRLGVLDLDDDDLAEREAMRGDRIHSLTPQQYRLVARYRRDAYVLDLAEQGGPARIVEAIQALERRAEHDNRRTTQRG